MAPESADIVTKHARHATHNLSSRLLVWAVSVVAGIAGFTLVYSNVVLNQLDGSFTPVDNSALISDVPAPVGASDDPSPDPLDASAGKALNILLMGSDIRDGENGEIGGRVTEGMRNDTTIIMHISADRSRVDLVSIPRDAQVTTPDCKLFDGTPVPGWTGDFNIAFSNGGKQGNPAEAAACTINSVQKLTGLKIDHWAVADFAGFRDMIDAVGGVPMCIPEKIVSKKARLKLEPGPQVLTGRQALALVRMRTAEVGDVSGSDLQRIGRQHDLLQQVSRVILSKNLLTDADELTQVLKAVATSLTMNPELADSRYLLGLAFSLRSIDSADINFYTVPWKYTDDYLDVLILDSADTMWEQLRDDEPLTEVGDSSAGDAWDEATAATPEPIPTDADPTEALLSACEA